MTSCFAGSLLLLAVALTQIEEAVGLAHTDGFLAVQPDARVERRRPRIVNDSAQFTRYMAKHGRVYQEGSQEYALRMELYSRRAAEVQRLNSQADRLWTAGLNVLSDRTDQELKAMHGYKPSKGRADDLQEDMETEDLDIDEDMDIEGVTVPKKWSWSELANMKYIRDQGSCGSCWAVTATTVLGAHSEVHGTNRSFSTQQIVDCVPNPDECGGTGGCDGATVELAFQYAMFAGLKDPEKYGAYTAQDGQCDSEFSKKSSPTIGKLTGFSADSKTHKASDTAPGLQYGMWAWKKLKSNKYNALLKALYQHGPVAVALAASDLMYYESGVFDGCSNWVVNHAVTLIGYGKDSGVKYWHVQNSWGSGWGEDGHFRLLRQDTKKENEENCGMDEDPQAGIACKGEVDPVKVCGTCGILYDSVVPFFDKEKITK